MGMRAWDEGLGMRAWGLGLRLRVAGGSKWKGRSGVMRSRVTQATYGLLHTLRWHGSSR